MGTTACDKAVASPPKLKMKMKPDAHTNKCATNAHAQKLSLFSQHESIDAVEIARRRFALEM